jgi:hypothetical protein
MVESHLVDGLDEVFRSQRVMKLSDHEVSALVRDTDQVCAERKELRARVASLEQGRSICRQIAMCSNLGPVSLHRNQTI